MAHFLIIGAASAMGQATADHLKRSGHQVLGAARNNHVIQPDFVLDADNFESMNDVFAQAKARLGGLHGVVNFAGSLLLKPAHLTTQDEYQAVIESSLTTAFATVRSAAQHLEPKGSVVLISSAAASIGLPNHEAIAAAKAGIEGLVRSAAATYASRGLRFNAVAPGLVDSPLTHRITQNAASLAYSLSLHGLNRVGKPEDVARGVSFLLDPENEWLTGQVLRIDGGLGSLKKAPKG